MYVYMNVQYLCTYTGVHESYQTCKVLMLRIKMGYIIVFPLFFFLLLPFFLILPLFNCSIE